MTRIAIATPIDRDHGYAPGYGESLALLLRDNLGVSTLPARLTFDCDIVRARNRAVRMVLRDMPDVTHVLWWDSDIVPEEPAAIGVRGMLQTGEHFIGAQYLRKSDSRCFTHMGEPDARGCVRGIGFGFTVTSVACLKIMAATSKKYTDFLSDGTEVDETADIFDLQYDEHPSGRMMKLSEDFSACKKWRDCGGRVTLYTGPGSRMGHVGAKVFAP